MVPGTARSKFGHVEDMGASTSTLDCATSTLTCPSGVEPQEVCLYGPTRARGPHTPPEVLCDWEWAADGNYTASCTSELYSCECPGDQPDSLSTSALGPYMEEHAMFVYGGPALLWGLTLILPSLYLILDWKRTFALPYAIRTASTIKTWFALCALSLFGLIAFNIFAPSNVWGECAQRGVCVYHMMFCEATRHHTAIRHPANFWSNLPFLWAALGILCVSADEYKKRSTRPNLMLDTYFGLLLFVHSFASFAWHGSNCTSIHFVDIALMSSVIAFFPYRFIASSAINVLGWSERKLSVPVALGYISITLAICISEIGKTPLYHESFPTGRARSMSLKPLDIMCYIGMPGLYPMPLVPLMAMRKSWGCVPAIFITVLALPIGFCGHALERLVADVGCMPTALLLQPTAILHWGAGLAIMGGYVQIHALEDAAKIIERSDEEVEAAALKVQTAMRAAAVRKEASQKARRNSHAWTEGEWTAEL